MRKMPFLFALTFVMFGLLAARDGFAVIYKYVDKNGVVCYADDLQSVPETYRTKAVIVSGELKEDEKRKAGRPAGMNGENEETATMLAKEHSSSAASVKSPLGVRLSRSLTILAAFVIIYIALGKIRELETHERAVSLARITLGAAISLYLVFAHVDDVIHAFSRAGDKVEEVKKQSEQKGEKAAKALKSLDALTEAIQKAQQSPPEKENDKE